MAPLSNEITPKEVYLNRRDFIKKQRRGRRSRLFSRLFRLRT